ncbi:ribonuclease P protein subunit p29 [Echinococcus multilocularis]|uniref:Ribonuclease P protein subunit p29 n=1 Tax=Echinococcus multilocularis TaxID=6211 RepID=A0A068XVA8_ECHMU|nr:ribonuclease P protein subunit p29 [Echinococcus multilocularis]
MSSNYASEFVKSRILPHNRSQAIINLDEFGSANYIGLAPQTREVNKKPAKRRKKPRLLPQFRGQTAKQLKRLLRREQSADLRREMTCPINLPRRLNDLWNSYAKSLVNWTEFTDGGKVTNRLENVLRMDLIGARMRVLRSISTKQVDLEGVVTMETRNIFYLATEDDSSTAAQLHIVPKRGTVLLLLMPGAEVALNGSSLAYRPIDRTLRKWKLNSSAGTKKRKGALQMDLFTDFLFSVTDPVNNVIYG